MNLMKNCFATQVDLLPWLGGGEMRKETNHAPFFLSSRENVYKCLEKFTNRNLKLQMVEG